jgi:solute carrier family 25 carnitine/acylcarnitine transporter 20/29
LPLSCAADVVKIQRQVDHGKAQQDYGTSWQAAADIVRRYGTRGLFRGLGLTTARDTAAFAVYFATYDALKARFAERIARQGTAARSRQPAAAGALLPTSYLMVAGGCAGVASWVLLHPVDVMKSLTQGLPLNTPQAAARLAPLLRRTRAEEGSYRFLLRGIVPTVVRAFPCSAITLPVFEYMSRVLHTPAAWAHDPGLHR